MIIFEINKRLAEAIENRYTIDEETGEVIEGDEAIELIHADFKEKADAYAHIILCYQAEAEAIKKKKQELEKRQKQLERTAERMKDALQSQMKVFLTNTNQKSLKTDWNCFKIRRSKSVNITDEELIPSEFLKVTRTPMKDEIRKAITKGEEVAGAELVEKESLSF